MSRSVCSKTAMALVIASALLMSPFISALWAKAERSQSQGSGNNSRSERATKAPSRSENRPSSASNESTSRAARPSRTRENSPAQSSPQISRQQPSNPPSNLRSPSRVQPRETENSQNVIRGNRPPVEVRVERPTQTQRIETPTVITTNQGTNSNNTRTPVESRRGSILRENSQKSDVTISPNRTARIASTIETPKVGIRGREFEKTGASPSEEMSRKDGENPERRPTGKERRVFERIRGTRRPGYNALDELPHR